jgi:hypothetical protein
MFLFENLLFFELALNESLLIEASLSNLRLVLV